MNASLLLRCVTYGKDRRRVSVSFAIKKGGYPVWRRKSVSNSYFENSASIMTSPDDEWTLSYTGSRSGLDDDNGTVVRGSRSV